jgi:hypothetical protein
MSWSRKIFRLSGNVSDQETNENYFNGLHIKLLIESFPELEYVIWPQYPVQHTNRELSINSTVTCAVPSSKTNDSPVMFLDVKPPANLYYNVSQEDAAL